MQANAVIFTAREQVEWGTVQTPDPGPDDIVVRTRYSWISNGTEGSFLRCERVDGVSPWEPGMPPPYPMVAGYQKVGLVEAIGANVRGYHLGQWVFASITRCNNVHFEFAGHIEVGPVVQHEVYPLPDGIDPVAFSGLVLTQVGFNSGSRPPITHDTRVVVMGDGMVGLWTAQTLQQRGARVALVGRHKLRLDLFQPQPGDLVVNTRQPNWLDTLKHWAETGRDDAWRAQFAPWPPAPFDVVVDTIGNEVNYDLNVELIQLIRWGGHFVTTGHDGSKATMDLKLFINRECTLHTPCAWTRPRMEATRDWIAAGRLQTLPLITHRMPAREAASAWQKILHERDKTLGVILEWD